ncbi:D-alanyl-D-alanine carboxypeptidase family protein [Rhizobium rhizoryzae]|uniref:D-alanyl-D-alanine carboxypeptidase (Penicillin-binding protein 5/6) n=1 Tax=Rhizobium rhizoryzae TaxID=451876 RepID=A0A7W6LGC9_9HYPH|nr:D-alanyl-D-alanine carboxypeptidase family protein [Rhizobium rhizoryzae]MBB4143884.1 D-alanyl-D-alanine carboxypeptidase (penicillin-binding protein 5/6) [Rhizobium rhizoryzae]
MSFAFSRSLTSLFVAGSLFLSTAPVHAEGNQASLVIDVKTGQVLEADRATELHYPASLTKMMTLYMTFEALHSGKLKWTDRIKISENANNKEPYKFAIGAGNTISVREAVEGMIVISANDAATAMGEYFGGTEEGFGKLMTVKARQLGMANTVFKNPAGLPDPEQVTTAADMAKLGMALMRDFPEDFKMFSARSIQFRSMKIRGHNGVLNTYPGASGIKTGYTDASGYNLVTSVSRGGRSLVGVVLGGKTAQERDETMKVLLDRFLPADPTAVAKRPGADVVAPAKTATVKTTVAQP